MEDYSSSSSSDEEFYSMAVGIITAISKKSKLRRNEGIGFVIFIAIGMWMVSTLL